VLGPARQRFDGEEQTVPIIEPALPGLAYGFCGRGHCVRPGPRARRSMTVRPIADVAELPQARRDPDIDLA
jgi:hypothetical protein